MVSESSAPIDILLVLSSAVLGGNVVLAYRAIPLRAGPGSREVVSVVQGDLSTPLGRLLDEALPRALPDDWDRVGQVQVEVTPAGAHVSLGDRSCVAPCTLPRVEAGVHDVAVDAVGYFGASVRVQLDPGQTQFVRVDLEASEPRPLFASPWFWVVGGLAVVAAVVGGVAVAGQGPARTCFGHAEASCPW